MANWKWFNKAIGKEGEYIDDENNIEYEDDGYEEQPQPNRQTANTEAPRQTGSVSGGANSLNVKIFKPREFKEIPEIAKNVLAGYTLVLNLEQMNKDDVRRVIDYFGGVTLAIDGGLKRPSNFTYIISPHGVAVSSEVNNAQQPPKDEFFN